MAVRDAVLVPTAGAVLTPVAASAGGDQVETGPDVLLIVFNDSAAAVTATLVTPGTVGGLGIDDATLTVPAGGVGAVKLDREAFWDGAISRAQLNWSATASVTFAVLRPAAA